jgi:HK97 family phage major capsid protein
MLDLQQEQLLATFLSARREAQGLSEKKHLSSQEERRFVYLTQQISCMKRDVKTIEDLRRKMIEKQEKAKGKKLGRQQRAFAQYLRTGNGQEYRDAVAGVGVVANPQGGSGGYFVPNSFYNDVLLSLAQTDRLLHKKRVTLCEEPDLTMPPKQVSSWDLSTVGSSRVGENSQNVAGVFPTVAQNMLNRAGMHRLSLSASYEFSDDSYFQDTDLMSRAFGVGFARGIGAEVAQVLLAGATNSGITIPASVQSTTIQVAQLNTVYFALNRVYRNSDKCAWVMNDKTYEQIRNMATTVGGPLLDIANDKEEIFGKKVLISPSIPGLLVDSGVTPGKIIFGDLSHLVVRLSKLAISVNRETFADSGKTLFTGRMRADSAVIDASAGSAPAIIYATLSA